MEEYKTDKIKSEKMLIKKNYDKEVTFEEITLAEEYRESLAYKR